MATIVCLAPYKFLPAEIGGQKAIALFYTYLSKHHQLVCLTTANNKNDLAEGYKAFKAFPNSRWRYINLFLFFKIKNIIRSQQATYLQVEHPYMGWLAVLLKYFCGVKLIVRSHNIEALRFRTLGKWWWKILWHYEKYVHHQADINFFITNEDLEFAVNNYMLDTNKCMLVTYGTELTTVPPAIEKREAAELIREKHHIVKEEKVLVFTGSFNYKPNIDALNIIENKIAPILDHHQFLYKIIVCGPWLNNRKSVHPNILLAGFVTDIDTYFKGADIFINPVIDGGGIKTKVVEALACNTNVISTKAGALGVNPAWCNGKLQLVADEDWTMFAKNIMEAKLLNDISADFYEHFYWGEIAGKAAKRIKD